MARGHAAGHLCLVRRPLREAGFVIVVTVVGFGWECFVSRTGWIAYPNRVLVPGYAPYWMAGLWALFAFMTNPLLQKVSLPKNSHRGWSGYSQADHRWLSDIATRPPMKCG
ncbi:DUF2878 family protein [Pandoraea terrigena]|uniref:DUF2878 family protein n=1 Tax=Pandoraea terrigena TaxID=2508292 RepID=UPI00124201E2